MSSSTASDALSLPIRTAPICLREEDHWDRIAREVGLHSENTATEEPAQLELWWSDQSRRPVIVEGTTRCDQLKEHWVSLGYRHTQTFLTNDGISKAYQSLWTAIAQRLHKRKKRVQKTKVQLLFSKFGEKGPSESEQWHDALGILA